MTHTPPRPDSSCREQGAILFSLPFVPERDRYREDLTGERAEGVL